MMHLVLHFVAYCLCTLFCNWQGSVQNCFKFFIGQVLMEIVCTIPVLWHLLVRTGLHLC